MTKTNTPAEEWEKFCDVLRDTGREVLAANVPNSCGSPEQAEAEGFRYLAGLVTSGLRQAMDMADPDRPRWLRNPDSTAKWGAENADTQYLWARIDPEAVYRVAGNRGSSFNFLIEVREGYAQLGDDGNFANLSASDLVLDREGNFEITIGGPPVDGNWLPLDPDATTLLMRQYFYDWGKEAPATFTIEKIPPEGLAPFPLDAETITERLGSASRWIRSTGQFWNQWIARLREDHVEGEIAAARRHWGGAEEIYYGNDIYRLGPGEALILETEVPDARYWGFQLGSLWFHSLDYVDLQTSINGAQAELDSDGLFRCVIAHEDPEVANWLDACGHLEGMIQYRWIWTKNNPRPTIKRVAFDEIESALPADTRYLEDDERRRRLINRRRNIQKREPYV